MALRKVTNVQIERANIGGFIHRKAGYRIGVRQRGVYSYTQWSDEDYQRLKELQWSRPMKLLGDKGRTWWWYRGEFYAENDGYDAEDVQLLLWDREQKKRRKLERLKTEMLSERAVEKARRERIPEDVRVFVWKRDDTRCVQCGSQEDLEFDHIIPVSKGGSNTARNIQLLCETCNRKKGDGIQQATHRKQLNSERVRCPIISMFRLPPPSSLHSANDSD